MSNLQTVTLTDVASGVQVFKATSDGFVDANGTTWKLSGEGVTNWYSGAPVNANIQAFAADDGGTAMSRVVRQPKVLSIEGYVSGGTAANAIDLEWSSVSNIAPTGRDMTLTVTDVSTVVRSMVVKVSGTPAVAPARSTMAKFQIPLTALDPRKYGPVVTTGLIAAGGSYTISGVVGMAPSYPTYVIHGAYTGTFFPTIKWAPTATATAVPVLTVGVSVPSGSTVTWVGGSRAVLFDGTTYTDVSKWCTFAYPPPVISVGGTFSISSALPGGGAGLVLNYSPAWW